MRIRPKRGGDQAACLQLLWEVHRRDGYPTRWPTDPGRFLTPPYEHGAWVAVGAGRILGHVAIHHDERDPVLDPARRLVGLTPAEISVVARLLVAPDTRHRGTGRGLLTRATAAAHRLGRRPVLDVAQHYASAIGLYEACGWTRAGALTIRLPDGSSLESWLYLGPDG